MSGPTLNTTQVGTYSAGTRIDLSCYARGQSVKGYYSPYIPGGWDNLWYRVSDGYWIADVDIDTGSNNPITPACPAPRIFNPDVASTWALMHVNDPDLLQSDCTYFVSRAWWNGGLPRTGDWTDGDPNAHNVYGVTFNAAVADGFKNYVVNNRLATITQLSWSDPTAGRAQVGDVIAYDWNKRDGSVGPDGVADHLAIVVAIDAAGRPIIAQHTPGHVRHWDVNRTGTSIPALPQYAGARVYLLRETA